MPRPFHATKDDLLAVRDELRTHFDTVADRFTDQFKYLHDWVDATANGLAVRVDALGNRPRRASALARDTSHGSGESTQAQVER